MAVISRNWHHAWHTNTILNYEAIVAYNSFFKSSHKSKDKRDIMNIEKQALSKIQKHHEHPWLWKTPFTNPWRINDYETTVCTKSIGTRQYCINPSFLHRVFENGEVPLQNPRYLILHTTVLAANHNSLYQSTCSQAIYVIELTILYAAVVAAMSGVPYQWR